MYRIHQIKLPVGEPKDKIPEKILKKIGGRDLFIKEWEIVKESIDARDKQNLCWVYSVDFNVASRKNPKKNLRLPSAGKLKLETAPDMTYHAAVPGSAWIASDTVESSIDDNRDGGAPALKDRPVVVGLGPAGLFCGLVLAQAGYKPIILERGKDVDRRHQDVEHFWATGQLNPESNVQFGEGGAGTFSDGKLTTGIKDVRIRKVLDEMVAGGAPADILYKQKPHIGTDLLRTVVKNIRQQIIALGGQVWFESRVESVHYGKASDGSGNLTVTGVTVYDLAGDSVAMVPCQALVLAVGHSARDTFRMLRDKGIAMKQKPFSIGVRIEHPQDVIDRAQYGQPARELGIPVAEYKINHRCAADGPASGRGVYTFCMCPGGHVVAASSQEGGMVVNGMSYHDRDSGVANSALLCDVRTSDFGSDDVLAGVEFQEKYERLAFEAGQRQAAAVLAAGGPSADGESPAVRPESGAVGTQPVPGKPYCPPKSTWGQLRDGHAPEVECCLPAFALEAFREAMPNLGRKLHGFDADDAIVTAVETRSSSPVRIIRGDNYEGAWSSDSEDHEFTTIHGFYPCGEGAGYAGGITSAAVDGIRVAEAIISQWKPASCR